MAKEIPVKKSILISFIDGLKNVLGNEAAVTSFWQKYDDGLDRTHNLSISILRDELNRLPDLGEENILQIAGRLRDLIDDVLFPEKHKACKTYARQNRMTQAFANYILNQAAEEKDFTVEDALACYISAREEDPRNIRNPTFDEVLFCALHGLKALCETIRRRTDFENDRQGKLER